MAANQTLALLGRKSASEAMLNTDPRMLMRIANPIVIATARTRSNRANLGPVELVNVFVIAPNEKSSATAIHVGDGDGCWTKDDDVIWTDVLRKDRT